MPTTNEQAAAERRDRERAELVADQQRVSREAREAADDRLTRGLRAPSSLTSPGEARADRREANRAAGFRWDSGMETARGLREAGHRLTPDMRLRLGHYERDRSAAETAGTLEAARQAAEGTRR